jgi:hypothetical protein
MRLCVCMCVCLLVLRHIALADEVLLVGRCPIPHRLMREGCITQPVYRLAQQQLSKVERKEMEMCACGFVSMCSSSLSLKKEKMEVCACGSVSTCIHKCVSDSVCV